MGRNRRWAIFVVAATALAGCASGQPAGGGPSISGQPVITVDPRLITSTSPTATPYAGPLSIAPAATPDEDDPLADAGAALQALECAGPPYTGGDGSGYHDGLAAVQRSAAQALAGFVVPPHVPFGPGLPTEGYRIERASNGRVLFSYDVGGRTKAAVIVDDRVHDYLGQDGWGVETWAMCDPAEFPETFTASIGLQIWTDRDGNRVPTTKIQSYQGAAHCDWQHVTFLQLGRGEPGELYLRDPDGTLAQFVTVPYDAHASLPRGATDTGYHRDGRELWIAADRSAAYLVGAGGPGDAERWPAATQPIGCA